MISILHGAVERGVTFFDTAEVYGRFPVRGSWTVLEENLGAVNVELTAEELLSLNDALSKIEISGDRYPKEYAKRTGK